MTDVNLWYDRLHHEIATGAARDTVPSWALGVLRSVASGRPAVRAIRHPLGFLCLPIERAPGYGVCLHLWSERFPGARTTTSAVHCHSWDLLSFVLYGRLANVAALVTDSVTGTATGAVTATGGAGTTYQVFEVTGAGEIDEVRATGRTVRLRPGRTETYRTGDTYGLPAGAFHSTVVENGQETATVALGRDIGGVDLSLGPLDAPTHVVRRRACDAAETARAAGLAAERLAATVGTG